MKHMKLSQLAQSPSARFLRNGFSDELSTISDLYKVDARKMRELCRINKKFYPQLLDTLRTNNQVLTDRNWQALSQSIVYTFFSFLITTEIVNQAMNSHAIEQDVHNLEQVYPQTQEQLLTNLSFSHKLQQGLFAVALNLLQNSAVPINTTTPILYPFTKDNLQYVFTKKMLHFGTRTHLQADKLVIGVVGGRNIVDYLPPSWLSHYTVVDYSDDIQALYRLPKQPNAQLRKSVAHYLKTVFSQLEIGQQFPVFHAHPLASEYVSQVISLLLPIALLEQFSDYHADVSSLLARTSPSLVLTAGGQHHDLTGIFLAEASSQHIPVCNFQHGTGYCEFDSMVGEQAVELYNYPTEFFTWGDSYATFPAAALQPTIHPVGIPPTLPIKGPAQKVERISRIVLPLEPIYFYQTLDSFSPSQPGFVAQNHKVLFAFLQFVAVTYPDITIVCKIKPGHLRQFSLQTLLPPDLQSKVQFTDSGKLTDYFGASTLILCPNVSGAFHESLAAGVPFLLYAPSEQLLLKPFATKFLQVLHKHHYLGETGAELQEAISHQMQQTVNRKIIAKQAVLYLQHAYAQNSDWQRDVTSALEKLLHKV